MLLTLKANLPNKKNFDNRKDNYFMRSYKTQMEAAKKGIITPEMKTVAEKEYKTPEEIMQS